MRMWQLDRIPLSVCFIGAVCLCLLSGCMGAYDRTTQHQETLPVPIEAPPPPVLTESERAEEAVRASFGAFTAKWMNKRAKVQETYRKVKKHKMGFSAEYAEALPTHYVKIKKTQSKETPYIGILSYYKKTFRSTAKTKKDALKGPFEDLGTGSVSEIFRYTGGKWVY